MFLSIFMLILLIVSSSWAARVNVFLNVSNPIKENLVLELGGLNLLIEKHVFHLEYVDEISSTIPFRQIYLGGGEVPSGRFDSIGIKINKVCLNQKSLKLSTEYTKIPINLYIRKDESVCIFIVWDVKSSVEGSKFIPRFYARIQERPLRVETVYATCEDTDTLFAIRADTNQVIASLGISGGPKDLVADSNKDRLYVLSENERKLNIIELSNFRKMDSFFLPLVSNPRYLALVGSNDAVITDPESNYVILIDLSSGGLIASKRLGYSPSQVIYSEEQDQIFVSSPEDQVVYVLDHNLNQINEFSIGQNPRGIWEREGYLYITDYTTGMINFLEISSGDLRGQVMSGLGAVRILGTSDRIYVTNQEEGSLSLLTPDNLFLLKKISVGKEPFSMVICSRRGWLYVGLLGEKAIAVIDTTAERLIGKIKLGCRPFGLAIVR